jgi:hypothetical protein
MRTLEIAHFYAKTVTLGMTHWPRTNAVMKQNRRMGVSMSGIAQYLHANGPKRLIDMCDAGYAHLKLTDAALSKTMGVPTSIKLTSIKPSGTVSLLAGATPGLHHPISAYYIRRMRLPANSPMVPCLVEAGYFVEEAKDGVAGTTVVVEVPVAAMEGASDEDAGIKTVGQLEVFDQMAIAALLQRKWADNAVSCTVTFDPTKPGIKEEIVDCLKYFQHDLKGISFLPSSPSAKAPYPQMPYEEITKDEYERRRAQLRPIKWTRLSKFKKEPKHHAYCDGEACERQ